MFTALNEKPRKKLMTGVCIVHTTDDFCFFSLLCLVCLFETLLLCSLCDINTICHKSCSCWVSETRPESWCVVVGKSRKSGNSSDTCGWTKWTVLLCGQLSVCTELHCNSDAAGERHWYPWWQRTWKKFRHLPMNCEVSLVEKVPHLGQCDPLSFSAVRNNCKQRSWERNPQLEQIDSVPDGSWLQK